MTIGARTEQQAAGAEAADEDGEYRGRRRGRRAEDQPEFAEPADLVHESAETGSEEQEPGGPGSPPDGARGDPGFSERSRSHPREIIGSKAGEVQPPGQLSSARQDPDEEEADGHAAARSIEERASPDTVDAVLFEDWID